MIQPVPSIKINTTKSFVTAPVQSIKALKAINGKIRIRVIYLKGACSAINSAMELL